MPLQEKWNKRVRMPNGDFRLYCSVASQGHLCMCKEIDVVIYVSH